MPTTQRRDKKQIRNEPERVRQWREDCLVEAGVCRKEAAELASTTADLHVMLKAYKNGCGVHHLCIIFADIEPKRMPDPTDE